MKNFKKMLFAFVCLFGVGMINANATVKVNGTELTEANPTMSFTDSGSISWNSETKELTIDSVKATLNTSDKFISVTEEVKIILKGESEITNTGTGTIIDAEHVNLTIAGAENETSSLKTSSARYSIWVHYGNLVIDNATLDLTSTVNSANIGAIEADSVTIKNDSDVKINAAKYAIINYGKLNIEDSKVEATSSNDLVFNQKYLGSDISINIKNSDVTAKSATCTVPNLGTNDMTVDNSLIKLSDTSEDCNIKPVFVNLNNKFVLVSENADGSEASLIEVKEDTDLSKYKYVSVVDAMTVTAESDENSTVELSSSKVLKGSTVDATITVKDGYKLTSVLVNDKEMLSELKDGKLTLTVNENTTVKVTSELIAITPSEDAKEEKEENPKTGDNIIFYVASSITALAGISYVALNIYRRKHS